MADASGEKNDVEVAVLRKLVQRGAQRAQHRRPCCCRALIRRTGGRTEEKKGRTEHGDNTPRGQDEVSGLVEWQGGHSEGKKEEEKRKIGRATPGGREEGGGGGSNQPKPKAKSKANAKSQSQSQSQRQDHTFFLFFFYLCGGCGCECGTVHVEDLQQIQI